MQNSPDIPDSREALARDMGAVARIGAVPSMLKMICEETGMGFAAVARVTDETWTACAVHDLVNFGLKPGGQLELQTTLCFESRAARAPIIIDRFSDDATYCNHHTPKIYGLESYISVPIVLPNGEYFGNLCAIDARPAKVSEQRVVRMFEVFANLIAMQLDNEERQWSTEQMLSVERENAALREQFIAVLGHDLRNPLSAVHATAELMILRKTDAEISRAGQRLKRTVIRMGRLIDDVMDFARGRLGGGLVLSVKRIDNLDSCLRLVMDELAVAHPSRNLRCTIAVESLPEADIGRLQQMVSNLIGNALAHGQADSPITLNVSEDAGHLVIRVNNLGAPIPPHVLAKVFEPYWRPATSAPGGGLGLGLFICRQIANAHGGSITATSEPETGTTFIVRIPLLPQLSL